MCISCIGCYFEKRTVENGYLWNAIEEAVEYW